MLEVLEHITVNAEKIFHVSDTRDVLDVVQVRVSPPHPVRDVIDRQRVRPAELLVDDLRFVPSMPMRPMYGCRPQSVQ